MEPQQDKDCWKEGGACRVAGHVAIGALAGGASGAAGAGVSQAVVPTIGDALRDTNLPDAVKQVIVAGLGVAIGAAAGGTAGAITGGNAYRTTLQAWKYTLPAFLLPFAFVLEPAGAGLLLKPPADVAWGQVAWIVLTATVGIGALAGGAQNWVLVRCSLWERGALVTAGLLLVYPHPVADMAGLALVAVVLLAQWRGWSRARASVP